MFFTNTKNKASVVERFNRTLKEKMYRYFTYKKEIKNKSTNLFNKRYLDVLPQLLHSYNNSYHRSIKTTPAKVNKKNEQQIFENLYCYKQNDLLYFKNKALNDTLDKTYVDNNNHVANNQLTLLPQTTQKKSLTK